MTEFRIWHTSRDPHHCAFRMLSLLLTSRQSLPIGKLRILDMYFLYPPLLHRLSLPTEEKAKFRELKVTRPEKNFVRLPGTASVWQDLQVFQSTALKQLAGRGLLNRDALESQNALLDVDLVPPTLIKRAGEQSHEEKKLLNFLTQDVAKIPFSGKSGLVKRAGIPARGPVQ